MGMSDHELTEHCRNILASRRIKNRIVILCEGHLKDLSERRSPQFYRKMEQMPDSNFYKACVPKNWREGLPQFFNCGDRNDVVNTFFTLQKLHNENPMASYLNPKKLYAIIDSDIQPKKLEDYHISSSEDILFEMYNEKGIVREKIRNHKIFVTGLIHKEAYFLTPGLQPLFDEHKNKPVYNGNPLVLSAIYTDMANSLTVDGDIIGHEEIVNTRLQRFSGKTLKVLEDFQHILGEDIENTNNIGLLLMIKKAKPFWKQLHPGADWTSPVERFHEQLLLTIANHHAGADINNPRNHWAVLFSELKKYR